MQYRPQQAELSRAGQHSGEWRPAWLPSGWCGTPGALVALGVVVVTALGGWFLWTGRPFSSQKAGPDGVPGAAFLATDPELRRPCPEEGCEPDWSARGRDGVSYRLVRVDVENRDAPRVLAIPERLLDRSPFPDCGLVATSATISRAGVPGRPVGCRSGVVSRIALVGTLPGFEPAGRASLIEGEERTDVVTMVIDVTRAQVDFRRALTAGRDGGLESWLTAWGVAMARKGFAVAQKQPLHGLRRLGPEHGYVGRDAAYLSDVLYTGEAVGGSSDVLMCTVEEALVDDRQLKPGIKPPPATCWHWFVLPDLGLDVRLSYHRSHLPDWRQTRQTAAAAVGAFARTAEPGS
jgi:hypothetical protein